MYHAFFLLSFSVFLHWQIVTLNQQLPLREAGNCCFMALAMWPSKSYKQKCRELLMCFCSYLHWYTKGFIPLKSGELHCHESNKHNILHPWSVLKHQAMSMCRLLILNGNFSSFVFTDHFINLLFRRSPKALWINHPLNMIQVR